MLTCVAVCIDGAVTIATASDSVHVTGVDVSESAEWLSGDAGRLIVIRVDDTPGFSAASEEDGESFSRPVQFDVIDDWTVEVWTSD